MYQNEDERRKMSLYKLAFYNVGKECISKVTLATLCFTNGTNLMTYGTYNKG